MTMGRSKARLGFIGILLVSGAADAVAADPVAEFYAGKQIRLLISTDAGTTYDVYGRVLAEHMAPHIPGKPSFIVQNMPGAAGVKVANYIYAGAPRDGTVFAGTHSGIPTSTTLTPEGTQYDVNKLGWIGSITKEVYTAYVWHTSPVQSFAAARDRELIVGSQAIGSAGTDLAIMSNEFVGTKLKIITGYKSAPEVKLALEKGEVQGTFANAWSALKQQEPTWITDRKVTLILQHGFEKHPEIPDVPLFIDQAKTPQGRQALELMLARQETGKPYFVPPDVPAERLTALRRAFDATMKDPAFAAALNKVKLDMDGPLTGERVAAMTLRLSQTSQTVVQSINAAFDKFRVAAK